MTIKLLVDCGAYSAWTSGSQIKLGGYVQFIWRNLSLIDRYLTLDLIPGVEGERAWQADEIEYAAKQSYRNHSRMKQAGLIPVPVFHRGERWHWLDQMLNDGETFIALAPLVWNTDPLDYLEWLDDCFAIIPAHVRVHGLGITSSFACHQYSWHSTDSRTWLMIAGFGQIPVPIRVNGRANFKHPATEVAVTARNRHHRDHFDGLSAFDRDRVHHFLAECGTDLKQISSLEPSGLHERRRVCLHYYAGLAKSSRTDIVLVTRADNSTINHLLDQYRWQSRLLSYHALRKRPDDALAKYLNGSKRDRTA